MTVTSRSRIKYELPRIVLGVIFLLSGLNGFLEFVPAPQFSPEGNAFINQLKGSGFFWPLLKSVEIVGGILLLFGAMGQVGVLVLAPVCAGIVLFHTFLSPEGRWLAYGLLALEVAVIAIYWRNFAKMFAWSRKLTHQHHAHAPTAAAKTAGTPIGAQTPSSRRRRDRALDDLPAMQTREDRPPHVHN